MLTKADLPPDVLLDVLLGTIRLNAEGDKSIGFRVQCQFPGNAQTLVLLVTWEDGQYRLLDGGDDSDVAGAEIWERAEKGELAGARRLLDWIREAQQVAGDEDPLAGPLLQRFWTRGDQSGKDEILLAAAAILANDKYDSRAIPFFTSKLEQANSDRMRAGLLLALGRAYAKRDRPAEAQRAGAQLVAMYPSSATAFRMYTDALARQQLWKESRRTAEERLKRLPDDIDALRVLNRCAFAEGSYEEADRQLRRLVALGKSTPGDWNEVGWQALFLPPVPEKVLLEVQRGMGQNLNFSLLHTLAMLYAETGKTTEARDVLWQAMDVAGLDVPDSSVWLVVGRMAEQFGARASALAAYRKVEKAGREDQLPESNYVLAQKRIAALAR
jgi:tetratricopeptide (TPR) repeat protein